MITEEGTEEQTWVNTTEKVIEKQQVNILKNIEWT